MPIGITNATTISLDSIVNATNSSNIPELFININNNIYGGWFYFIMLWVLWFILFVAAQRLNNLPLQNLMYTGAAVSVISLFLRAVYIVTDGITYGLLTDFQFWVFPLITIILATILYALKDS